MLCLFKNPGSAHGQPDVPRELPRAGDRDVPPNCQTLQKKGHILETHPTQPHFSITPRKTPRGLEFIIPPTTTAFSRQRFISRARCPIQTAAPDTAPAPFSSDFPEIPLVALPILLLARGMEAKANSQLALCFPDP